MDEEKRMQLIQAVENLRESDVYKVEIFISGLHAGEQIGAAEAEAAQQPQS